jgi:hypothetical protein
MVKKYQKHPMKITTRNNLDQAWTEVYSGLCRIADFKDSNFAISVNGVSISEKINSLDQAKRKLSDALYLIEPFMTKEKLDKAPRVIL